MDLHWMPWHRQLRDGTTFDDELAHVTVGDLDPTSHVGTANGDRACRFEWAEEMSLSLTLLWSCTRDLGHQGQHLAGTSEEVAAVHPQLVPATLVASVPA